MNSHHRSMRPGRSPLAAAILWAASTGFAAGGAVCTDADVRGFDNLGCWSRSAGDAALSTDRTQGASSFQLSRFWYTELTSIPSKGSATVGDAVLLDARIPEGSTWGSLSLVAHAPSVSVYEHYVGQVNLSGSDAGKWGTFRFAVSTQLAASLAKAPSDLVWRLRLNLPWSESGLRLDNLRFTSSNPVASKIEIRVPDPDDIVYLFANGLRHKVGHYGGDDSTKGWRDVSAWFSQGSNKLRVMATSWGNPAGFHLDVRVDGILVKSWAYSSETTPTAENGVYFHDSIQLDALRLPPAQEVRVVSGESGKLYLDNEFTGLSTPATLKLPAGTYRVGLGVGSDAIRAFTGRFHEKTVTVGSAPITLDMETSGAPLGTQNRVKMAVLPVKYAERNGVRAIMTQAQVDRFASQIQATRTKWLKPFSYGLTDWDVTILPTETQLVESETEGILDNAKYLSLANQYNFVVLYVPSYDANGAEVPGLINGAWSGGQQIWYPAQWVVPLDANSPNEGLLHEALHQYDSDQRDWMHQYTGVGELHGATEHGFQSREEDGFDWVRWYRYFIRGQAGETSSARAGVPTATPLLTGADWYVGTFRSIRFGLDTPEPK